MKRGSGVLTYPPEKLSRRRAATALKHAIQAGQVPPLGYTKASSRFMWLLLVLLTASTAGQTDVAAPSNATPPRMEDFGPQSRWFREFQDLPAIERRIQALEEAFPSLLRVEHLREVSYEGRDIKVLHLSSNVSDLRAMESKPVFVVMGGQHAREWVGPSSSMYLAEALLTGEVAGAGEGAAGLLERAHLLVLPVANPDGYAFTWSTDRMWRKNRRPCAENGPYSCTGVDLNRNWAVDFGVTWHHRHGQATCANTDCDSAYPGLHPFSEAESAAIRDVIMGHGDRIKGALDIHCWDGTLLSPWLYTNAVDLDHQLIVDTIGINMAKAMSDTPMIHPNTPPKELTFDYRDARDKQQYTLSGAWIDWIYGQRGVLASYLVELPPRWDSEDVHGGDTTFAGGFQQQPKYIVQYGLQTLRGVVYQAQAVMQGMQDGYEALGIKHLLAGGRDYRAPVRFGDCPTWSAQQAESVAPQLSGGLWTLPFGALLKVEWRADAKPRETDWTLEHQGGYEGTTRAAHSASHAFEYRLCKEGPYMFTVFDGGMDGLNGTANQWETGYVALLVGPTEIYRVSTFALIDIFKFHVADPPPPPRPSPPPQPPPTLSPPLPKSSTSGSSMGRKEILIAVIIGVIVGLGVIGLGVWSFVRWRSERLARTFRDMNETKEEAEFDSL